MLENFLLFCLLGFFTQLIDGAIGAPLAAYLIRRIHSHILMLITGLLIISICLMSLINLIHS